MSNTQHQCPACSMGHSHDCPTLAKLAAAERERDVAYDARRNADVYARRHEEQAQSAMRERDEARTRAEQIETENQTLRQKIKDLTFIIENPKL